MLEILINYHQAFLGGLLVTLKLIFFIALIGIPLGVLLGVIGARYSEEIGNIVSTLDFFTSAIPVIVLLFWLHYPLQSMLSIVVDPFWTTVGALGLLNTILTAKLVQHEMKLIPKSYRDAAHTLGLSHFTTARVIELPILARRIIPNLLTNQSLMLQYTLLASFISVPELFRVAQNINSIVYKPVEVYSLLVLFFLVILGPLHLLAGYLKRRYAN
jgi:ABC-type amino acid transport system permease subunit